jgi:hypothetical protein
VAVGFAAFWGTRLSTYVAYSDLLYTAVEGGLKALLIFQGYIIGMLSDKGELP